MLALGMQVLIEDKSGCSHVVPFCSEQRENWRIGTCTACSREVAQELNDAGHPTGLFAIVERVSA
jgi:hypothetical protein